MIEDAEIYYFGVWPGSGGGHYLWTPDGQRVAIAMTPFGVHIDGQIHPTRDFPCNGHGIVHMKHTQLDGWSAIAFWDFTGDSRPGSNSVFVVRGLYTMTPIIAEARRRFPTVWTRLHRVANAGSQ